LLSPAITVSLASFVIAVLSLFFIISPEWKGLSPPLPN
jgi:hypothetical protein